MTRTLEQAVRKALLVWDTSDVEGELKDCMEDLRAALKEREKRLPYQVILENGLAEIRQRLERIEEIIHEKESSEESEGQKEARTGKGLCEHENSL